MDREDRLTLGEVQRRLAAASIASPTGKGWWDRSVIAQLLKNPAYIGQALYGRTRNGPWKPGFLAQHGRQPPPRSPSTPLATSPEDWITIPVPVLVEEALFAQVQAQLAENRQRARQSASGARYMLLVCTHCGYAYHGVTVRQRTKAGALGYYRCVGADAARFGGERQCWNPELPLAALDEAVWRQTCELLQHPQRIQEEYQRRWQLATTLPSGEDPRLIAQQSAKLQRAIARLVDAYTEGWIDKAEFAPRLLRLRQRQAQWETQAKHWAEAEAVQADLQGVLGRLEEFARTVSGNWRGPKNARCCAWSCSGWRLIRNALWSSSASDKALLRWPLKRAFYYIVRDKYLSTMAKQGSSLFSVLCHLFSDQPLSPIPTFAAV